MRFIYKFFVGILFYCLNVNLLYADTFSSLSPSKNMKIYFNLSNSGEPYYWLEYKGRKVIDKSKLGFELKGKNNLLDNFSIVDVVYDSFDETWTPVWGEVNKIRNNYNELLIKLKQRDTQRLMNIRFRIYDEGVGFRYEFPQQKNLVAL